MDKYRFTVDEAPVGKWRTHRPVVETNKCMLCGMCAVFCPTGSISVCEDDWQFDSDYCKGCGICVRECPVDAIHMQQEVAEDK